MDLSLVSNGRAVGTKIDANGKVRRPADYTVNTFSEYLDLARTHVGVFTVSLKREVALEIAARAEALLNQYELSARMSGRPYKKVLLSRIENQKWNPGYGISQIAENGAPVNGLTRFQTFSESSQDYLTFTMSFGADPKDYYQFDESMSVRTNEDHWLTLGYKPTEAKYLSGMKLAAKFLRIKITSRDTEVEFYEAHRSEVDTAREFMNTLLDEERVPYKEAFYALILAKGILNKVDGVTYLKLINNVLIKGNTNSKWEMKFRSLFEKLGQNDLKKASVWTTLRKAAEFTIAAKTPYDVQIIRPKDANTKMSIKLISGAWKAPEVEAKPSRKKAFKGAKAGK
jgi:hypothetical protein